MRIFTLFISLFIFLSTSHYALSQNSSILPDSIAKFLPDCPFQIEQIRSSNDGEYMAVCGLRNCPSVVYREVSVYKTGTSLNSNICNTFLTTNMKPVKMKWIGDKLYIYQPQHNEAVLKKTKVLGKVTVVYPDDIKSFY